MYSFIDVCGSLRFTGEGGFLGGSYSRFEGFLTARLREICVETTSHLTSRDFCV